MGILDIGQGVAALVGAGTSIANAVENKQNTEWEQNMALKQYNNMLAQQERAQSNWKAEFDYLKQQDALKQQREDTAYSRAAADLESAGYSKNAILGASASTAGGSSPGGSTPVSSTPIPHANSNTYGDITDVAMQTMPFLNKSKELDIEQQKVDVDSKYKTALEKKIDSEVRLANQKLEQNKKTFVAELEGLNLDNASKAIDNQVKDIARKGLIMAGGEELVKNVKKAEYDQLCSQIAEIRSQTSLNKAQKAAAIWNCINGSLHEVFYGINGLSTVVKTKKGNKIGF